MYKENLYTFDTFDQLQMMVKNVIAVCNTNSNDMITAVLKKMKQVCIEISYFNVIKPSIDQLVIARSSALTNDLTIDPSVVEYIGQFDDLRTKIKTKIGDWVGDTQHALDTDEDDLSRTRDLLEALVKKTNADLTTQLQIRANAKSERLYGEVRAETLKPLTNYLQSEKDTCNDLQQEIKQLAENISNSEFGIFFEKIDNNMWRCKNTINWRPANATEKKFISITTN